MLPSFSSSPLPPLFQSFFNLLRHFSLSYVEARPILYDSAPLPRAAPYTELAADSRSVLSLLKSEFPPQRLIALLADVSAFRSPFLYSMRIPLHNTPITTLAPSILPHRTVSPLAPASHTNHWSIQTTFHDHAILLKALPVPDTPPTPTPLPHSRDTPPRLHLHHKKYYIAAITAPSTLPTSTTSIR